MRILLADDHHLVREALSGYLSRAARDIYCVEAASVEEVAEKLVENAEFDLIVLDFRMPGMNGFAGLERVLKAVPAVPTAIISGEITPAQAMQAIDLGAAGIIRKDLRGTALLGALRLLAAGEKYIPSAFIGATGATQQEREAKELRASLGQLTRREFECVRALVSGATNREIAALLDISEVTVKLHLNSTFKKMGARNRSDAVRIAMLQGVGTA